MPKKKRERPLYQRGGFRLDWDRHSDGSLRSPNLAVFWYDPVSGRGRSNSTGTTVVEEGKAWLDAFYLERSSGRAVCPTCLRPIDLAAGHLVSDAIANYQTLHADRLPSSGAISARLSHMLDYLATLPNPAVPCETVDETFIARFRDWSAKEPIVSPKGQERERTPSTTEASVAQLSAAINFAYRRGDTNGPARFKAVPIRELNRTPQHRADVDELAAMLRYCVAPDAKDAEERARRLKERAALHRFLMISIATLARPDAAHDVSTLVKRKQWNAKARILSLNPAGRRQTKKYRATVRVAWQVAHHLDQDKAKFFVGPKSIRKAWEGMADDLGLPIEGESGMKLIRRSVANIVRERLPAEAWDEIEMFLGHRKFDAVSDLYAPFQPTYLKRATAEIETLIGEIEKRTPGAFALPGQSVAMLRRG
jgi:integrase